MSKTTGVVIICNPPPEIAKYLGCSPIASIEIPYIGEYWEVPGSYGDPPEIHDERIPHASEPIMINLKDNTGFYIDPMTDEVGYLWAVLEEMILMEPPDEMVHVEYRKE